MVSFFLFSVTLARECVDPALRDSDLLPVFEVLCRRSLASADSTLWLAWLGYAGGGGVFRGESFWGVCLRRE